MTKEEIIDETVDYYGKDPQKRRSVDDKYGHCLYEDERGNVCAFGRVLNKEGLEIAKMNESVTASRLFTDSLLEDHFRDGYYIDDDLFWDKLQELHDVPHHWCKTGLSIHGKQYVQELKEKYA